MFDGHACIPDKVSEKLTENNGLRELLASDVNILGQDSRSRDANDDNTDQTSCNEPVKCAIQHHILPAPQEV
jgi:hypothetical protein